jgi:hypothetical protein
MCGNSLRGRLRFSSFCVGSSQFTSARVGARRLPDALVTAAQKVIVAFRNRSNLDCCYYLIYAWANMNLPQVTPQNLKEHYPTNSKTGKHEAHFSWDCLCGKHNQHSETDENMICVVEVKCSDCGCRALAAMPTLELLEPSEWIGWVSVSALSL